MKETTLLEPEYIKFQEKVYALYKNWNETLSSQIIVEVKKVYEMEYPLPRSLKYNSFPRIIVRFARYTNDSFRLYCTR